MSSPRITLARDLPRPRFRSRLLRAVRAARLAMLSDATADRAARLPRLHAVCIHHVLDDEIDAFEAFLDWAAATHDLLTLRGALDRVRRGPLDRPALCLTFDDGFLHHLRVAESAERHGGRATFFLCTAPLAADGAARDEFCRQRLFCPPIALMDWSHAEALASRGHEIGCHSATHRSLAAVPGQELDDEIGRAREELTRRLGPVNTFAWPYGRWEHITADARRRIAAAGFTATVSAESGCHLHPLPAGDELCIRRDAMEPLIGVRSMRALIARSSLVADGRAQSWPRGLADRRPAP